MRVREEIRKNKWVSGIDEQILDMQWGEGYTGYADGNEREMAWVIRYRNDDKNTKVKKYPIYLHVV